MDLAGKIAEAVHDMHGIGYSYGGPAGQHWDNLGVFSYSSNAQYVTCALIECLTLTNPNEAAIAKSPGYADRTALAIAQGVHRHLGGRSMWPTIRWAERPGRRRTYQPRGDATGCAVSGIATDSRLKRSPVGSRPLHSPSHPRTAGANQPLLSRAACPDLRRQLARRPARRLMRHVGRTPAFATIPLPRLTRCSDDCL